MSIQAVRSNTAGPRLRLAVLALAATFGVGAPAAFGEGEVPAAAEARRACQRRR